MRVLLTGGTGFVGRAVVARLLRDGHQVVALVRDPGRAEALLGADVEWVDNWGLEAAAEQADVVVNLAGENLMGGRWTQARRQKLVSSRVDLTGRLARVLAAHPSGKAMISASAVGYYGDTGRTEVAEDAPPGGDFLAQLCTDWERACEAAVSAGVRVAWLRIGVVLGRGGGALDRMKPAFRAGVGGRIGHGRQGVSWIHLHDLVEVIARAVVDPRYEGAINAVAPEPGDNAALTRAVAAALHRPAIAWVPGAALKLWFGEAATVLTSGQRVLPTRLTGLGHAFRFPHLDEAVADALGAGAAQIEPRPAPPPDFDLGARPAWLMVHEQCVDAPLQDVFGFFSRPANLGLLTPAAARLELDSNAPEQVAEGVVIATRVRAGCMTWRWESRIRRVEPGHRFVDVQERGPHRVWWHEHTFEPTDAGTRITDRIWYSLPLGPLGRLAHALMARRQLRELFGFRAAMIALRFG